MNDLINQFGNINSTNIDVSTFQFFINLLLCAIFSHILSFIYQKYGDSLSNRVIFSRNFIPLALTTSIIITVVKSSLALSLGLVGALSIIRFRSAIKEPEELSYLFMSIALGLGFGANQVFITSVGFLVIIVFIIFRKIKSKNNIDNQNLHLVISYNNTKEIDSASVIEIVQKHSLNVNLSRYEQNEDFTEISLAIELNNYNDFNVIKDNLSKMDKSIHLTFLDNAL